MLHFLSDSKLFLQFLKKNYYENIYIFHDLMMHYVYTNNIRDLTQIIAQHFRWNELEICQIDKYVDTITYGSN